jgi:hypothetical protein
MSYTNQFFCTCLSGERYCRSSGGPASCPHNTVTTTATETTMKQDKEDSVVKEAKCAICGKILNPHDIAYGYHQCAGNIRANDREPETLHQLLASKDKEIAQLREEVEQHQSMIRTLTTPTLKDYVNLYEEHEKLKAELSSEKEKHGQEKKELQIIIESFGECIVLGDYDGMRKLMNRYNTYLSQFDETIKK